MGAWIEIMFAPNFCALFHVAPHVGAWIEMSESVSSIKFVVVAPHVGAWIEIVLPEKISKQ